MYCRLEAVASRFEDLEDAKRETRRQSTSTVTSFADAQPATAAPPPNVPPAIVVQPMTPPSVQAYDAIVIEARLKPLVELTAALAPQVLVNQVGLFAQALQVLRDLLLRAAACKKPDQHGFAELLNPLQAAIEAVTRAKEANRKEREWSNHLTVVAESVVCIGWVTTVSAQPFVLISLTRLFRRRNPNRHNSFQKSRIRHCSTPIGFSKNSRISTYSFAEDIPDGKLLFRASGMPAMLTGSAPSSPSWTK